jgi:hypothetical protein
MTYYDTFDERKDRYLKRDPYFCLFCESRNIYRVGVLDVNNDFAFGEIMCNDCMRRWTDVYSLTDVEYSESYYLVDTESDSVLFQGDFERCVNVQETYPSGLDIYNYTQLTKGMVQSIKLLVDEY